MLKHLTLSKSTHCTVCFLNVWKMYVPQSCYDIEAVELAHCHRTLFEASKDLYVPRNPSIFTGEMIMQLYRFCCSIWIYDHKPNIISKFAIYANSKCLNRYFSTSGTCTSNRYLRWCLMIPTGPQTSTTWQRDQQCNLTNSSRRFRLVARAPTRAFCTFFKPSSLSWASY